MKSLSDDLNKYKREEELYDAGFKLICGVDEVGRGSIAGPLVVAAVILNPLKHINGIDDSKKLSPKKRNLLAKEIKKEALAYATIFISPKEIDELDIYQATKKGMILAINKLKIKPDYALIDAMPLKELTLPHDSIIHGDALSASIGAASIIAKVTRDDYMAKMDLKYPNYGFKKHKGYCTKEHMEALDKNGPCAIHRKTFYPVSKYYNKIVQLSLGFENTDDKSCE